MLDQFRQRRARNQHPLIDVELQAGKPAAVREIDGGHASGDAPLHQRLEGEALLRADGAPQPRRARMKREAQGVPDQSRGVVARIVRAVAVVQPRALQAAREALQEPCRRQRRRPGRARGM